MPPASARVLTPPRARWRLLHRAVSVRMIDDRLAVAMTAEVDAILMWLFDANGTLSTTYETIPPERPSNDGAWGSAFDMSSDVMVRPWHG